MADCDRVFFERDKEHQEHLYDRAIRTKSLSENP